MKVNRWLTAGLFGLVAALAAVWLVWRGVPAWSIYGAAVGSLLLFKLALSLLPAQTWPTPQSGPGRRVAVVIPIYNEDPEILARCLASITAQTHTPNWVRIVDDGSTDPAAYEVAQAWAAGHSQVDVIWQPNAGKRAAMGRAFRELASKVDVFVCIDSDTVLEPTAIEAGLAPFNDPRTAAVTGTVVALNPKAGLLPRLLDLRYVNAFLYERAAYSRLGSVLCVCGSLAFWRSDIVTEHLDDFLDQQFLGVTATAGDDRHLTNLSLLHGRVVLAHGSVARTAVPERSGHFLRQQVRWGRSFFRESAWALSHLSPLRPAWWVAALESVSWAGFTVGLFATLVVVPALTGQWHVLDYLVWVSLAGYLRSVHMFSVRRDDWSATSRVVTFILAPLFGMVHVLALLPLRLHSLATLRTTGWGTRGSGAEVAATPALSTV